MHVTWVFFKVNVRWLYSFCLLKLTFFNTESCRLYLKLHYTWHEVDCTFEASLMSWWVLEFHHLFCSLKQSLWCWIMQRGCFGQGYFNASACCPCLFISLFWFEWKHVQCSSFFQGIQWFFFFKYWHCLQDTTIWSCATQDSPDFVWF